MILVLGGTTEGKKIAAKLQRRGMNCLVSTTTEFGRSLVSDCPAITGVRNRGALKKLLKNEGVSAVVDATHPFALQIKATIRPLCESLGISYFRLERAGADLLFRDRVKLVDDVNEAAARVAEWPGRPLLTTGVNNLGDFIEAARRERSRAMIFARILPTPDSWRRARRWLPPERLIAGVGPFSYRFNLACLRLFEIDLLVTKDSGGGSGVEEKIRAAAAAGIKALVIKRPGAEGAFSDDESLIEALRGRV